MCGGNAAAAHAPTMTAHASEGHAAPGKNVSFIAMEAEDAHSAESSSGNIAALQSKSLNTTRTRNMSLRRAQSLYQDPDNDDEGEVDGSIKETTMLRLGSVKNTGVFVNQYAVVKNLGSGSFGKARPQ